MPYVGSLAERHAMKVDRGEPGECWPWTACRNEDGYGKIRGGSERGEKMLRAHRVAYELAHDVRLPPGVPILHSCDNPPCCNPEHLIRGTISLNNQEASMRGRLLSATCPHGHLLSGDNLYVEPAGHRRCRACRREWDRVNR